jgi:hypothetical protein
MSDTKACTKCGVVKALTEYCKDRKKKDGLKSACRSCAKQYRIKYYQDNKEEHRKKQQIWRENNQERNRYLKARHKRENRGAYNAHSAKRRAQKLQATPAWADQDAIKAIYAEAQRLQETLGIEFHIDHIVPLQGELVCGLHVESNLQVIPAILNLKKSNKFKVQ